MTEMLTVMYDVDEEKNEKGICISRVEKEKSSFNVIKLTNTHEQARGVV